MWGEIGLGRAFSNLDWPVREDLCIGFLFGRLVPLGIVGSPVVAMLSIQAVNVVLLQCSSSMHGKRVRCVDGSNHGDVCLVSGGPPVASKGIGALLSFYIYLGCSCRSCHELTIPHGPRRDLMNARTKYPWSSFLDDHNSFDGRH